MKNSGFTQWLAEGDPEEERAADVAYDAERDAKAVIIERFDVSDSEH